MSTVEPARIGVLTVSDRASRGEYEDRGGPAIKAQCLVYPSLDLTRVLLVPETELGTALVERLLTAGRRVLAVDDRILQLQPRDLKQPVRFAHVDELPSASRRMRVRKWAMIVS